MNWFIECITKNYANFSGRARRKEYWMYTLFYLLFMSILVIASLVICTMKEMDSIATQHVVIFIVICAYLALFIPTLAVLVRRLHDINKSGWWSLISFVPYVGFIISIIFPLLDSTPGRNQYGENPKNM
ncbi:DUF805 domain-containing protein [Candidatus Schmidhempelia bombi]|uniref:DUF805 domain-containing protein n=1 Tax=Candidatus Schmidhempelia bombi str. Bimp TaxID=1387197 RepID=A0AB94IEK4_9GAMM|nr:DUF805 domain-containing protein [Candidatus Schmidhempelia bombi]TEA27922.1 DUF805 domain-containing protein [Candidatus Schmidhempelia bombi str. Bimp]